ncbi:hemerythrin domain-containing protein [Nocardia asteroides]|uniref:hemerythrin domain-containing protein n=1 Tax=Nocardia TaxID=1817 RepID=UPI00135B0568|nr:MULTISPECIES: hemerythrin domain-containing protein [Nocardia]UAK30788.1 hemerythrin domain-containing protein [Nocardia asteroides]
MATTIDSTTDAIDFLVHQHGRIRQLFVETADTTDPVERESKFFELRRLLAVHETAEEEIIHPRARREIGDGASVVDARLEEENKAKKQLAAMEELDISSMEFQVKLAALREAVLAHADHEEREEFTQLREELDADTLQRMRRTVELAETMAPTRPHPGVESATANVLVGPFAAMMDRAKDAISKPRH